MIEFKVESTLYDDYPFNVQVWVNKTYAGIGRFCKDINEVTRYMKRAYRDYEESRHVQHA